MVMSLAFERQLVLVSVALLLAATLVQFAGLASGRAAYRPTAVIYAGVVMILGAAITGRWIREHQGPFLTLYEILLSGVFSLALMFLLISVLVPAVRGGWLVASPLLLILGVWLTGASELAVPLPGAFKTPWLWAHVLSGKLFLGFCLCCFLLRSSVTASCWWPGRSGRTVPGGTTGPGTPWKPGRWSRG
jgi:hypothetical protein